MWNRTLAGLTIPGPCRDGEYGVTLRRDCGAGYRGYQYRHCMADGAWGAVEDGDCGRLAAGA